MKRTAISDGLNGNTRGKDFHPCLFVVRTACLFCCLALGVLFFASVGWAADVGIAPSPLPHVKPVYEGASFWIGRLSQPEKILLEPEKIEAINQSALRENPDRLNIGNVPETVDTSKVIQAILRLRKYAEGKGWFDHTNHIIPLDYYERLFSAVDTQGLPPLTIPRYGLTTRETDLRLLPTRQIAMEKPLDYEFDQFQNDRLECALPVVILHQTRDRSWYFVGTRYTEGWVRASDVAEGGKEMVMHFALAKPLVVTGRSVSIYADGGFRSYAFDLPMGARLPFVERTDERIEVLLPSRDFQGGLKILKGYVRSEADVHIGYLPYAAGHVFRQAFKLLHDRYSWGGAVDGRDCSRLIMEVFRCFGFDMPRNSFQQAAFHQVHKVDVTQLSEKEKVNLLERFQGVPTLLYMPGHIMLFLGVVDSYVYAIHSAWEYKEQSWFAEKRYHIGRVVVSDLSLGGDHYRGSLLRKISRIAPMN